MREALTTFGLGTLMGVSLSRIGFSSWDEVHAMFTFESLRLLLTFGGAVALLAVAWPLLARSSTASAWIRRRRPVHPGSLAGGAIFGAGWALTGACPSIAMVQLGEGQLGAVWTLLGILAGNWLYAVVHARYFRWDTGSCAAD